MERLRSIAVPITALIIVLVSSISLLHYFIQVESLRTIFLSQNKVKAEHVHFMIQSFIDLEKEKLEALSHSMQENQHLIQGISEYVESGKNFGFVRAAFDRIYQRSNVDIVELIGRDRSVIYRANDPERIGDYAEHWGVDEALEGIRIMATSHSDEGWGIRVLVPVIEGEAVFGAIMLGTIIDDDFATNISKAIGVEISIGSMQGMIATSNLHKADVSVDFETLILSLTEGRGISVESSQSGNVVLYAPLLILDEVFGFVAEVDATENALLIEQSKKQIFRIFVVILLIALAIGVGLTFYLIRPLSELTSRAVKTVRDISGDTIPVFRGNEVGKLVRSFDLMIQKVMGHLSERKKAEKLLMEEKELLAITLRSIGDAVITTDIDGRIQLFNQAAEDLTGWSQEEVSGKHLGDIYKTIDEVTGLPNLDTVNYILELNGDLGIAKKSLFTARDGTERIIFESGSPIIGEDGVVLGTVVVFRDITQQKKQEEDTIKAYQLESLGTLAGGIAHDFNNILTAILGNANLASLLIDTESKAMGNLKEIERASKRAKKLSQKLLTFSKGGEPIRKSTVMDELIRDSANTVLNGTDTKCNFHFDEGLWPAHVDKIQVSQVVRNLCLNAHESMPEGGAVEIRAGNTVVAEGSSLPLRSGEYIKLSITDHGGGIPPKDLLRIYDPYFSTKKKGGGLGLSIVHSIVEKHAGHIAVKSELDKGTAFTIYLPAISQEGIVQDEKDMSKPAWMTGRILFMDDDKMLRDVASEMLEIIGYKAIVTGNGEETVALFSEAHALGSTFDAVILDLTIPSGMGGREVVKELISIDPSVKAIVASGYSNDPVLADFEKFGFKGAIVKPFDTEKLKGAIDRVLGI